MQFRYLSKYLFIDSLPQVNVVENNYLLFFIDFVDNSVFSDSDFPKTPEGTNKHNAVYRAL